MTKALTYVEIDVPQWTQTSPDSPATESTLRFAVDTEYLPLDIPAIPSIIDVSVQPATISLGQDLGQRAVVTVTFRDHRHIFDGEDFNSGTFWGKFRARYGLTLQGNPFRLIRGTLGQDIEDMETRHFLIDSSDGPANDGSYQIVAKDIFSLTGGDKVQAPGLSNGLITGIGGLSAGATVLVPFPVGIESEYPNSGYVLLGGTEIVAYTQNVGFWDIVRGQFNTVDQNHDTEERIQLVLVYEDEDPADIIYDLLVTYAGINPDYISLNDWQTETSSYLGSVYSAIIVEPKPVDELLAELVEQASLSLWWDDLGQRIRLQVLRQVSSSTVYDQQTMLAATLEVREQPEKRLSHVQVYFGKFDPLLPDDNESNYRGTVSTSDATAVEDYGSAAIKKIMSRWIPADGRTVAETLANKQLGRYRDPPRAVRFSLMRDQPNDPQLGGAYFLGGTPFQTTTGTDEQIQIQVTRLNPRADRFEVEAEEMLWTPFGTDIAPPERTITLYSFAVDINLRDAHDMLFPEPNYLPIQSGDVVTAIIQADTIIGNSGAGAGDEISFNVDTWPVGVTINIIVNGRIQGRGGAGGAGGNIGFAGDPGSQGGTAIYTRYPINLTSTDGQIWGGGGGGGGSGATVSFGGLGGGGGAGYIVGPGGAGGSASPSGEAGTTESGGSPNGGNPGQAGTAGASLTTAGGAGGAAGTAIDGISFVTTVGAPGDIQGPTIN
jgi:hypothetical protein